MLLCSTLLTVTVSRASARDQQYYFSVDKEVVNVYWNADGTLSLDYVWTFTNQPGAHVIDFVDVGMPNRNFDIYGPVPTAAPTNSPVPSEITPTAPLAGANHWSYAEADGKHVSISSDYQGLGSYGFSVDMGAYAIQPGQTGTVHVYAGGIHDVLYTDDQDSTYASAVFSPTWFDSQYVTGSTDLTVIYHLPPGLQSTEPRWHEAPKGFPSEPLTSFDDDGRITYTWQNANASGSTQYTFGTSFPKAYVLSAAIGTKPPVVIPTPGFSFKFDFGNFWGCSAMLFCFVGIPLLMYKTITYKKMDYLPPKVSIEGHGIKRGLTAVEAAILMEQPLDKVMTMILFGILKKGAAQVVTRDPLELSFPKDQPAGLYPYETDFIKVFMEKDMFRRDLLSQVMVSLVKLVSEKMRGFSRKETVDYYKSIMEDAWKQVEASDTPEVKSENLDNNLEWMMLDKNYDDRSRRAFHGPIYVPTWWDRYDPTYRPATTTATSGRPVSAPISSGNRALPGADFAASVVGGVQNFSTKIIGDVGKFTDRISNITNPPPPVSHSSSSGHSGGHSSGGGHSSCACACACAGCACACAGGGR
jgi:hypothetical protein